MFCHIDYIHIHIFIIVTILFVGSINNFGINLSRTLTGCLDVCYFHKDLEPGLSQNGAHVGFLQGGGLHIDQDRFLVVIPFFG